MRNKEFDNGVIVSASIIINSFDEPDDGLNECASCGDLYSEDWGERTLEREYIKELEESPESKQSSTVEKKRRIIHIADDVITNESGEAIGYYSCNHALGRFPIVGEKITPKYQEASCINCLRAYIKKLKNTTDIATQKEFKEFVEKSARVSPGTMRKVIRKQSTEEEKGEN